MNRRPLLIFYLLVGYIFVAFSWWIVLLARITNESYEEKRELTQLNEQYKAQNQESISSDSTVIEADHHKKIIMIVGEGAVFLVILFIVKWKTTQSLHREVRVNH